MTLAVFNTLGQRVATLVNGGFDAGYHEVQFEATRLASGVYFLQMQVRSMGSAMERDSRSGSGDFIQTKRLLLVR